MQLSGAGRARTAGLVFVHFGKGRSPRRLCSKDRKGHDFPSSADELFRVLNHCLDRLKSGLIFQKALSQHSNACFLGKAAGAQHCLKIQALI